MFVGKFNFSKVCSNVFSPAFRDLPPVPAQNINQNNNNNKSAVSYHHAESRQRGRLQHQPSNAGDSGPTDLRKRSGGDQQQQQQQRRLRRAPSARGNSKAEAYQMAVKHKIKIEKVKVNPAMKTPEPLPEKMDKEKKCHAPVENVKVVFVERKTSPPPPPPPAPPPPPPPEIAVPSSNGITSDASVGTDLDLMYSPLDDSCFPNVGSGDLDLSSSPSVLPLLLLLRTSIMEEMAASVARLGLVNRRLDELLCQTTAEQQKEEVEEKKNSKKTSNKNNSIPPFLLPATKSLSFPFLCEGEGYRPGDEYFAGNKSEGNSSSSNSSNSKRMLRRRRRESGNPPGRLLK